MFNAFKTGNFNDWQKIPMYLLCRWLSGKEDYVLIANELNNTDIQPSKELFEGVHKIMRGFIPFPKYKVEKTELTEDDRKTIEMYHLGTRDINEIRANFL